MTIAIHCISELWLETIVESLFKVEDMYTIGISFQ